MPTILITGATDGIGLALAQLYTTRGDKLILVGRRPLATLDAPLFTPETYCQADLSHQTAPQTIEAHLKQQQIPGIDVLIHNAGLGYFGAIADQPLASIAALVDVNFRAPIALTHRLLPYLKGGRVVFISSVASVMPTPDYAVYTATKAALDAFADNLRMELEPDTAVTLIHPGATQTGMHRKANMPGDNSKYALPEVVAASIIRMVDNGQRQGAVGVANKLLRFVGLQFPKLIDATMIGSRA